jgi:hypothetical protein
VAQGLRTILQNTAGTASSQVTAVSFIVKRLTVKPGDRLPIRGIHATVVSSDGAVNKLGAIDIYIVSHHG